ncbi:MAG: oligosaccharide flippase family protein [Candidatus Omnitrophota bacterium]
MLDKIQKIGSFNQNILIVFAGTSVLSFFNLLYQLLIAHKLPASEFASFNSLLSVYILIFSPLSTIQTAVVKYSSEFNANNQLTKLKFLLSGLLKKAAVMGLITLLIFSLFASRVINILKIHSVSCGYILAGLIALAWFIPVFSGAAQGLELFGWFVSSSVISGALKLIFAFILILLGFNIAGALSALLLSTVLGLAILYFPLRKFFQIKAEKEDINYREIFSYLFPVALAIFCFAALTNMDMVLVKYFFTQADSGIYSLAQMIGKIFLFLPAAISIVMFPKTCGLHAKKMDTLFTLKMSLLYVSGLCIIALLIYNIVPAFILLVLTGKTYAEPVLLGRLFAVSMSFFALLFVLISYSLSINDLRFIKYLIVFTLLQVLGIMLFHRSLITIQVILCINSVSLFFIHFALVYLSPRKKLQVVKFAR